MTLTSKKERKKEKTHFSLTNMVPYVKDTLLQWSKDVVNSMQMDVVTVVLYVYHRVTAYSMQSAGEH